jgi:hypothetical protein
MFNIFSKNTTISNTIKTRLMGAELFYSGGRIDEHDEANSDFSNFCERA